mgnify:CR=1 FL=1
MKLTRSGCVVPDTPEIKKELTVRPIVNADFGVAPPSFKVFRKAKSGLCVPRYYAEEKFGKVTEDIRPKPEKIKISLRKSVQSESFQIVSQTRVRIVCYTEQKGWTYESSTLVYGTYVFFGRAQKPGSGRYVSTRIHVPTFRRSPSVYALR